MTPIIGQSGKGETVQTVKRSVVAKGWWDGGRNEQAQTLFRAVKLLCMILYLWTSAIIHLSKFTQCTTLRVSFNVN